MNNNSNSSLGLHVKRVYTHTKRIRQQGKSVCVCVRECVQFGCSRDDPQCRVPLVKYDGGMHLGLDV